VYPVPFQRGADVGSVDKEKYLFFFFFIFFLFFSTSLSPFPAGRVFASLPQVERGVSKIIGGDPKGSNFLYTNGKCVVIRNVDVMYPGLFRSVELPPSFRFDPQPLCSGSPVLRSRSVISAEARSALSSRGGSRVGDSGAKPWAAAVKTWRKSR